MFIRFIVLGIVVIFGHSVTAHRLICERPSLENGSWKLQRVSLFLEVYYNCDPSFELIGSANSTCRNGKWDEPKPTCVKEEASAPLFCDFETETLCGWKNVDDSSEYHDWIWFPNMLTDIYYVPSKNQASGHYMQSTGSKGLLSPVYQAKLSEGACFQFWFSNFLDYDELSVYVKPKSIELDEMLDNKQYRMFQKASRNWDEWEMGSFNVPVLNESFQIVFTAFSSSDGFAGIDDVKLMIGSECSSIRDTTRLTESTTTEITEETTPTEILTTSENTPTTQIESEIDLKPTENTSGQLSCDFETDMCGWTEVDDTPPFVSNRHSDWELFKLFPNNDAKEPPILHYMRTFASPLKETKWLLSPVYQAKLSKDACFEFRYNILFDHLKNYMLNKINVYVKPESIEWDELLDNQEYWMFQNRIDENDEEWQMGSFNVPVLNESFQIALKASCNSPCISYIAEVKLMTDSECSPIRDDTGTDRVRHHRYQ